MSETTEATSAPPDRTEPPAPKGRLPLGFRLRQSWRRMRSRCWLNLRVWVPFLLNPFERRRLVRFPAREFRDGMTWKVEFGGGCWRCGAAAEPPVVSWRGKVRAFEYPIQIIAGGSLTLLLTLLVGQLLPNVVSTVLFCAVLLISVGVFWAKSWSEQIEITIDTCDTHRDEYPDPQLAVYDEELLLFFPTVDLAKSARAQVDRRCREGSRAADYRHRSMGWEEEEG